MNTTSSRRDHLRRILGICRAGLAGNEEKTGRRVELLQLLTDDFFGGAREPHLVAARRDCAQRLSGAGYSAAAIGRMMKRSPTTILNYFPGMAEKKKGRYAARRLMRLVSADLCSAIRDIAKAENVSPEVLMSQWVAERATYEVEARARAQSEAA